MSGHQIALRFRAPDRPGILAAITPLLAGHGCDVRDAQVFGDPDTGYFFVRMVLSSQRPLEQLKPSIEPLARSLDLQWDLLDLARRPRVLVAVSKSGHCLLELIHQSQTGQLPIEIAGIVSNHETLRRTAEWHGLAYRHLCASSGKPAQESELLETVQSTGADLLVLARYMQILSDDVAAGLHGRCINIHHSFLPSVKGARPYHQAHLRGVKLIGATAHYVTAELDEGPIIEQDVRRVTHAATADDMVAAGREVEASVLARAVRWHCEHRIFLNGNKTVVLH